MNKEQFAAWLVDNGFAESERGYGHATGEEIAEALHDAGYAVEREERRW